MQHRMVGKTGLQASVIGLGAEHLDGKPYEVVADTIHAAIDEGVNIIDVFMPGEEIRKNIGKALAGKRDKVLLQGHIGSVDIRQQYDISRDVKTVKRYFEDLLRFLNTDYIDFGMLFFIDSEKDFSDIFETEFIDYALALKREGKIRHIGASSHNPAIARRVIETGLVEMMLFSINPAFDMMPIEDNVLTSLDGELQKHPLVGIEPARAEFYRLCEQRGVGLTSMKTFGAGKLLSKEHTPFREPLTPAQCIHYALSRPAVASVMLGCNSPAQIKEAVGYLSMTEAEKDYTRALSGFDGFRGSCVYCNHCLPCPAQIDIAAATKYMDIALLDTAHVPPSIRQHYGALSAHGGDCIHCGSCEKRCPFGVPIQENMERAARVFGE